MSLTYHGTLRDYYESLDANTQYVPAAFDADGFIHCRDGEERLLATLTAYYRSQPEDWITLVIDRPRLISSPMR